MLHIIISSYKEPKATARAIDAFLNQNIKQNFKITVVDPFPETEGFLKEKYKGYKNKIEFFLDPGEGKGYALNLVLEKIFSKNINDIIILTDGDVRVSENSVNEILNAFKDERVGCVTGRPIPVNSRNNKFGYWAHLLFAGIHKVRKRLSNQGKFFEGSGYLLAIRNAVLKGFSLETSDDNAISYLIWKKGYKIKYADKAEVCVLYPQNWKDYKNQKIRNIKAHENLGKIAKDLPRTKTFFKEIKEGFLFSLTYPKSIKEYLWTVEFIFTRLYIYLKAFYEIKLKKQIYSDGWRETEIKSTKPLD